MTLDSTAFAGLPGAEAGLGDRLRAGVALVSDNRISLADFFRLLHELALASGEETFTLSARPMVVGTAEFVFSSAANCSTIGEAMQAVARAYNILHGDDYNLVEQAGGAISYEIDDERFPYTVPRDEFIHFSLECTLIVLHSALCHLAGEDLTPRLRRVFTKRGPKQIRTNQSLGFWGQPIRYGAARYGLSYDAGVADQPLARFRAHVRPQVAVHNRILGLIEARRPPASPPRLGDQVAQALRDGQQFQDEIAARMGLSVATLRRRLDEEGEGFRALRHRVLNERAQEGLRRTGDIGAVADTLGFSDARSFARAFAAWNGLTPAAWIRVFGK
ncbi:MAG TPA: AraC family transcriptional regulator ligand-binding domain-containing protein [Caulobacteraceae bacterium]|jgi:AraC-like DNA-binding protein